MLSLAEINSLSDNLLEPQLSASIGAAVSAVTEKVAVAGAPALSAWNDCSADELKVQLPGSVLKYADDSFRYVPTSGAYRVASGVQQVRVSATGKNTVSWVDLETVTNDIKAVAWGVCTSNNKAGVGAAGVRLGEAAAQLRPQPAATFTELLVQAEGCAAQAYPIEDALKQVKLDLQPAAGNAVAAPTIASGEGFPSLADAAKVQLDQDWMVGKGAERFARVGLLTSLGVMKGSGASVASAFEYAAFAAGWSGVGDKADRLAVAMAHAFT